MQFERLTNVQHPLYERAMELYGVSFPAHEQREAASQMKILDDPEYHFTLVYDGELFVGLILYWETERFVYVEHFCILPEMRNRKYGQQALQLLCRCGKTIILEIDPPTEPVSIRRKFFYERCGFVKNPYSHIHPPYHRGNRGHDLVIMSFPVQIIRNVYDDFRHHLEHHVMADVFS